MSENPLDFGFAKNCGIPTAFEFEMRHIPAREVKSWSFCLRV